MSGHTDSPPPMAEQMLYLLNENRRLQEALDAAERERDEAQEHIARWLDENPPLSTTERVQRGSTGDLSFDMMRYAKRMKARAEKAEAALDRVQALLKMWDAWDGSRDGFGTSPRVRDALRAALDGDEDR